MMFARTHPAIASEHYRTLELESRITSANPHGLISIMYEELLRTLDLLMLVHKRGNPISGSVHHGKAVSIIIALDSSIDFNNGGELAKVLQRIYHSALRALNDAVSNNDVSGIEEVRTAISDIAYAWNALS